MPAEVGRRHQPVVGPGPMTPVMYRVVGRRQETSDVATISVLPFEGEPHAFAPGQFDMLSLVGVGEAAVSISSVPGHRGPLEHTIRDVGPLTHALSGLEAGDVVGLRGPFGTDWGIDTSDGEPADVVVVAGGIGLAPLRGAVELLATGRRAGRGRLCVLVGARRADQVVFGRDLERWAGAGAQIEVTVDVATRDWRGHVGLVTALLDSAEFDPASARALVCGPEVMMRFTARALADRGVEPDRILVSLERNMQCGLAWCGHCQLGPFLLCRDGPVLPYGGVVARLLGERER